MLKAALIGAGGMGGVHLNRYKTFDDVQLVAIADIRTDVAAEKANDKNIKIYSDYKELIANEKLDFVDICTPSYMHADMAIYALEHGLHVICEKPMVLNVSDGERVMDAVRKSGRFFMAAHVVRFMKPYCYLKEIINSKELGAPVHIHMSRLSQIPNWSWEQWMLSKEKSGLTPLDLYIHDVDFVQSVFGMPKAVSAVYHELRNGSDYILSDYIYDNFAVSVEAAWYKPEFKFSATYRAVFENGTIIFDGEKVFKNGQEADLGAADSEVTGINISSTDGYGEEIRYFIECINNGSAPEKVTPQSSYDTVKLIEETLKSCKKI